MHPSLPHIVPKVFAEYNVLNRSGLCTPTQGHRFAELAMSFKPSILFSLALASLASAHFTVNSPPPLGNNINNENIAPCGGFTPSSSDNITDFHVGGDAISLVTLHAQSYFAFLGTLGASLTSPNWTFLIPTVEEYGLNQFCEPIVPVPASWSGQAGLLQIIQDSEDGIHYQVSLSTCLL